MTEALVQRAKAIVAATNREWDPRFERILRYCCAYPAAFPGNMTVQPEERVLRQYVLRYYTEHEQIVTGSAVMGTRPDPVVNEVLREFFHIPQEQLDATERAHRLSMAAENLVGRLLEGYIATILEQKGWIWCCGNTMKAIDFLKDSTDPPQLLQIKNRDNSENSSSSAIRVGTEIKKWFRIASRTGVTQWSHLPDNHDELSEEGFYQYIAQIASQTP